MSSPIIVALDFDSLEETFAFVDSVDPSLCRLKVGKRLFTLYGPDIVKALQQRGFEIFLDLKFHDIPNTVSDACKAASDIGVWMVNVHALGGYAMLSQAKKALSDSETLLIAVTILTSHSQETLKEIGLSGDVDSAVISLSQLAKKAGLDGVVCSALEAPQLKKAMGRAFQLVTPGIRLHGEDTHDQKRVVTPSEAISRGADYLVIGRSITNASKPNEVLNQILLDIDAVDMK